MTHVLDQNLGSTVVNPLSTGTQVLTTSATAASGTLIVVVAGAFGAGSFSPSVASSPSLTWTVDKSVSNGSMRMLVASAYAASGLASGSTITVTYGSNMTDRMVGAVSFTGSQVSDTSRVDITGSSTTGSGSTWTSGAVSTANADDLLIGFGMVDGSNSVFTPDSPWNEVHDTNDGQGDSWESEYQIVASATSYTAGGDAVTNGSASLGSIVAYKAAAGAGGAVLDRFTSRVTPLMLKRFLVPGAPQLGFPSLGSGGVLGPTQFPQTLTATATSTATIVRQTNKAVTANATSTATIVKSVGKRLTSTVTSTATMAVLKAVLLTMTATATVTASIVKSVGKAVTANATVSATIVRQVGKILAPTVTTTATIVRQVGKRMTATVTSTATLSALKAVLLTITATVTSTATIRKQVGKNLSATATSTATIRRQINTAVTATVTTTATITKRVGKTLAATATTTASLVAQFVSGSAAVIVSYFSGPRPRGSTGSAPGELPYESGVADTTGVAPSESDFDAPSPGGVT